MHAPAASRSGLRLLAAAQPAPWLVAIGFEWLSSRAAAVFARISMNPLAERRLIKVRRPRRLRGSRNSCRVLRFGRQQNCRADWHSPTCSPRRRYRLSRRWLYGISVPFGLSLLPSRCPRAERKSKIHIARQLGSPAKPKHDHRSPRTDKALRLSKVHTTFARSPLHFPYKCCPFSFASKLKPNAPAGNVSSLSLQSGK
jgi:hypothetical protein